MCVVSGCTVYTPVDVLEFFPGNSFAIAKSATAKLKMKMLPTGFPVALCSTVIQFFDRHRHRSFLLLRIADLVVPVVDVLDLSVSETVAFRQVSVFHFKALF